ncbi:MAG: penicillin-binding protein 2 [Parasporobacterium sp.]|nr:penicillin-binding protein 2 [Parasporobacterium sp.]
MRENDRNLRKINRVRKKINKRRVINKDIMKVFAFFVVIFSALIIYLCYFLSFQAGAVINNSYNRRSDVLMKTVRRGSILSDDGTVLAYSETGEDGAERRIYPYGNIFSHVIGFDSNGRAGIEAAYNYYLLTSHNGIFEKISNEFHQVKNPGDDVQTTLNAGLQNYIYQLLGENSGAVICMNPDTGEIYAMVSKPDFDPNYISENWDVLSTRSDSVLLNRATQGLYTPGSTFKIFTLYEYYLEHPETFEQFSFLCKGILEVGDTTISCLSGAHGQESLLTAFSNSCNCAFGTIGKSLDLARFQQTNEALLFGKELPLDIPSTASQYSLTSGDTDFDIMATSIGQGNTQITPMHLAMLISSIANEGICMKPHLVKYVLTSEGEVTRRFRNEVYTRLFSESEAAMLKGYLRAVVTDGTGSPVYPGNFVAYGKTGTAQKESETYGDYDHSWFAGWAENNEQKLVVCVILENMDSAGTSAVYLCKQIFDYYFGY